MAHSLKQHSLAARDIIKSDTNVRIEREREGEGERHLPLISCSSGSCKNLRVGGGEYRWSLKGN